MTTTTRRLATLLGALALAATARAAVDTTTKATLNLLRGTVPVETVEAPSREIARALCDAKAVARAKAEVKISGKLDFTCQNEKLIVTATYSGAQLLFRSGFEDVTLQPISECWGTGCWQDVVGGGWPFLDGRFLLLSDPVPTTAANIGQRMFNRIDAGRTGSGLRQQISVNVNGTRPMGTSSEQVEFQFLPKTDPGDLYVSYWLKLQPDLLEKMATDFWGNSGTWRAIFAFKTGGQTPWGTPANDGDYRVEAYVKTASGQAFFAVLGDNNAGGGAPLVNTWYVENRAVPVPVGRWFKVEVFWHRSGDATGRVWFAADGQVIADRRGANLGARGQPVNRIIAPLLYSGSAMPIWQWVDDLEIWDGFPPVGTNAPYATH